MRDSARVYGALGATVLFWGLSFIATKTALGTIHPFAIIFYRFLIASFLFAARMLRHGFPKFSRQEHMKLALLSLFEPGLYFFCETFGLRLTSASIASLIIAAVPLVVALLAGFLLKEPLRARNVLAIGLSVVGITVLVMGDSTFHGAAGNSALGDLLIIGAVVTAAFYTILARDLGRTHSSTDITALQVFYGAVIFAPFYFSTIRETHWRTVPPAAFISVLFLALCATTVSYLGYNFALTKLSASRAAVFINGIPIVTTVAGWILLNEHLSLLQIGGAFVVLAAVYINSSGRLERQRARVSG